MIFQINQFRKTDFLKISVTSVILLLPEILISRTYCSVIVRRKSLLSKIHINQKYYFTRLNSFDVRIDRIYVLPVPYQLMLLKSFMDLFN